MFSVKMKNKSITQDKIHALYQSFKMKRHITQTAVNGVRNDIITPKTGTL